MKMWDVSWSFRRMRRGTELSSAGTGGRSEKPGGAGFGDVRENIRLELDSVDSRSDILSGLLWGADCRP